MTTAQQRTIVRVDGAPLAVIDSDFDPSAPTVRIELGSDVLLVGSTVQLIAFAGAIVAAVDESLKVADRKQVAS